MRLSSIPLSAGIESSEAMYLSMTAIDNEAGNYSVPERRKVGAPNPRKVIEADPMRHCKTSTILRDVSRLLWRRRRKRIGRALALALLVTVCPVLRVDAQSALSGDRSGESEKSSVKADRAGAAKWPAGKGLFCPTPFDPRNKTFVFVHGLDSTCAECFADFIAACGPQKIQSIRFEYPNQGPIAASGRRLAEELRTLAADHPGVKLTVVAHSMGGLVVRAALEGGRPSMDCATDVVSIATPHAGTLLADHGHALRLFNPFKSQAFPKAFLAEGLGEACRDLRPDSDFFKELATHKKPHGVNYHVIIGTRAFLTKDAWSVKIKEARRRAEFRHGMSPQDAVRLAAKLAEVEEVVHGLGDGVVAVRRAKLKDSTSERQFDLGHNEIVRVPEATRVWRWILEALNQRTGGSCSMS